MILKEKIYLVGWTLIAGGIAALISISVASLASSTSAIYRISLAGGVVFGTLVALGFASFLSILLLDIYKHQDKHQDLLFVSERDRLIDRSKRQPESPNVKIISAPHVFPEITDFESLDSKTRQALRNGGN